MGLESDVARLLAGPIQIGDRQQAFVLLTVDADGYPHAGLVSRRELRIRPGDGALLLALRGAGARANLARTSTAGLVAVHGETAHRLKLRVIETYEDEDVDLAGYALAVHAHVRDSVGVPLAPISYLVTAELAANERWDVVDRLLNTILAE